MPNSLAALGVLAVSITLAAAIYLLQSGQNPEAAVLKTAVVFAAILGAASAVSLALTRGKTRAATAGLVFLGCCSVLLLAIYFFRVSWYVFFPADFLTWSESDFIGDMLKFATGYPLYTPQVNNDSFEYVPGAQLLTYFLGWLAGKSGSVPFYRLIQVGYTVVATFFALLCCQALLRLVRKDSPNRNAWLWNAFFYAALLLMATNTITNQFTHNLHGDALAQLLSMAGYYLLLSYIEKKKPWVLAGMALIAPIGFLVKQSLVAWGGWYAGFLALCERSVKRATLLLAATAILCVCVAGWCYLHWGDPFYFWTVFILSKDGVSPLRSFQHLLDGWTYFAAGLFGGAVLIIRSRSREVLGAWLVWLGVLLTETYTSGIAWMMNHMGPGCLIAGVWFLAGLALMWDHAVESPAAWPIDAWLRVTVAVAITALAFNGMGMVRIPIRPISDDAYRYVHDIEREFQTRPANTILLDAGTWVYWKDKVIMGDRGPGIGDRGHSGIGDFSGILSRISQKRYSKILMRGFHDKDFIYDYYLWAKSSGIRQALIDNYRETGRIPAAQAPPAVPNWAEDPYYFGEITILEPKL